MASALRVVGLPRVIMGTDEPPEQLAKEDRDIVERASAASPHLFLPTERSDGLCSLQDIRRPPPNTLLVCSARTI